MSRKFITLVTVLTTMVAVGAVSGTARAGGPNAAITGDVTGDGRNDRVTLVDVDPDDCGVVVEAGLDGGGFDLPVAYSYTDPPGAGTPGDCPNIGTALDLSNDGTNDLLVGWSNGRPAGSDVDLLVLENFSAADGFIALAKPDFIGSGHFNGDLRRDIYEWSNADRAFATYLNGEGGDLTPGPMRFCASGLTARLSDVDRNGTMDAVITYEQGCEDTSSGVVVLLSSGTVVNLERSPTGATRWTATVQDENGDGNPDVVTTNINNGSVNHWIGNGGGAFSRAPIANADTATTTGTRKVDIAVLANDIATNSAALTIATPPSHGTVQITSRRTVVYTPNESHGSTDRFSYRLTLEGRVVSASVAIQF
ncbi:Ig-like domain-containing protein [Micromonospora sp. NBC_01796]|uniref:Ig-like domain-containing protein n=1 Tax=Micromonospora sp. NBC_01796 TaxID=2975987 RepID=UPI002DD8E4CE|nr:Ig-like domain-containing protein [Micromonospora sp. NBC_01796]WSA87269.1 Ig-like domain-containing protein [Micromonospora sp. NBC_01796]